MCTLTIPYSSLNLVWKEIVNIDDGGIEIVGTVTIGTAFVLTGGINTFNFVRGVWVCNWTSFVPLALALRFNLINIYFEKQNAVGVDEKMKVLYEYLTGNEFKHRVEGIVEAFGTLQDDIEREKRWFSSKWARQEKEIRKVIDHTHGMYGDLQGVTGRALPEIKSLERDGGDEPPSPPWEGYFYTSGAGYESRIRFSTLGRWR